MLATTAAVAIAAMVCVTVIVCCFLCVGAYVRGDWVATETDHIWNAIKLHDRDIERLKPIEMSLDDQ